MDTIAQLYTTVPTYGDAMESLQKLTILQGLSDENAASMYPDSMYPEIATDYTETIDTLLQEDDIPNHTESVINMIHSVDHTANVLDMLDTDNSDSVLRMFDSDDLTQSIFSMFHSAEADLTDNVHHALHEDVTDNVHHALHEDVTDDVMNLLRGMFDDAGEEGGGVPDLSVVRLAEINISLYRNLTQEDIDMLIGRASREYELGYDFYLGELIVLLSVCIPASLAIILYILCSGSRWTGINVIICWSRIISLGCLAFPLSKVLNTRQLLCTSLHLLLPALVLHEKICLTAAAILRYLHVFRGTYIDGMSQCLLFLLIVLPAGMLIGAPFLTLLHQLPPLYITCMGLSMENGPTYTFTIVYFTIWGITALIDIFCYIRIVNYLRMAKMRINTIPETEEETRNIINIVNGTSSLLIWTVTCASMLPTLILQYSWNWGIGYDMERTLGHYHIITVVTFNLVVPLILIGCSVEMRTKIRYVHTRIEKFAYRTFGLGREEPRADLYTISNTNNAHPA